MHTTALKLPLTVPPWQKPASVIRVLRRPRPEAKRVPGPALNKPQSKWTVLVAFILSVLLHVAAVAIVQVDVDRPPVEMTQAVSNKPIPTTLD
jgi:hypothetical protein